MKQQLTASFHDFAVSLVCLFGASLMITGVGRWLSPGRGGHGRMEEAGADDGTHHKVVPGGHAVCWGRNALLAVAHPVRAGDCLLLAVCVDAGCFGPLGFGRQYGGAGKALAMAAVRLVTPSRVKMFSRCFRTVLTETTSWRAISALLCPAASR
jgi:hypothetical protein